MQLPWNGTAGGDTLYNYSGNHNLFVVGSTDSVIGSHTGFDTFNITGSNSAIDAQNGLNDTINISGFSPSFGGAASHDKVDLHASGGSNIVNIGSNNNSQESNETVYGSHVGADTFNIFGAFNTIDTQNGINDIINIGDNSPSVGGAGSGGSHSSNNHIYLHGSAGGNTVNIHGSGNTVIGSQGPDTITINNHFSTNNLIDGQNGSKLITDNSLGNNTIYGGTGNSTIMGGGYKDLIMGLGGNDSLSTNASSNDTIDGTGGNNTISSFGNDLIYSGTGGNNYISFSSGAHGHIDYYYASQTAVMNDTINGFATGHDVINFLGAASNFSVNAVGSNSVITYNNETITVLNVTNLHVGTDILIA